MKLFLVLSALVAVSFSCPSDKVFIKYCNCQRIYFFGYKETGPELEVSCAQMEHHDWENALKALEGKHISTLTISDSYIKEITNATFGGAHIHNLKIKNTVIESFEEGVIGSIKYLKSFSMEKVSISELPDFTNATNLQELKIVDHSIREVEEDDFMDLENLQNLVITNGPLVEVKNDTFLTLVSLKFLDLSGNFLRKLPDILTSPETKLESIILSNNHLNALPPKFFTHDKDLKSVNLKGNIFKEITEEPFKALFEQNTEILLDHNPIDCDKKMCWFVEYEEYEEYRSIPVSGSCLYVDNRREEYVLVALTSKQIHC